MRSLVLLLAFLISTPAFADQARIATWNLGGFNQIPQGELNKIIEGLAALDADIVVLPELNPLSHPRTIAEKLSEPAGKCYHSAAPDQPLARQEIGFVFKCPVRVAAPGLIIGSDLEKPGYRNAAGAHVTVGQFDLVLIGLHLKAGRGAQNRSLRHDQLTIISSFIQGVLMAGEKEVLVIGDYNMIPGEDDENFATLNVNGSLRFVSSEDLAGEFSHISSSGSGNLLDGYAFTVLDESEYVDGSVEIVPMHTVLGLSLSQYRSKVTDHLPIVAIFNIDTDHD